MKKIPLDMTFLHSAGFWWYVVFEVLLVGVVGVLSCTTAILRDVDTSQPAEGLRPFSLAKSQLAFWTVLVVSAFLYVLLIEGQLEVALNATALALLGISMTTTALASPAGPPPQPPPPPAFPKFGPPPLPNQVPAKQAHSNFITDILSDNQGMNFHRLQMAIWTLVFGGIFSYRTVTEHKFPDFSAQTYVLMGMSSGTYVWLRKSET